MSAHCRYMICFTTYTNGWESHMATWKRGKDFAGARYGNPDDLAFRVEVAPDDTNYVQYAGFRCAADQVR